MIVLPQMITVYTTPVFLNRRAAAGRGINYIGPREVLLEFVILFFLACFMNEYFIVEIFWGE